jgi:hypothetical protein
MSEKQKRARNNNYKVGARRMKRRIDQKEEKEERVEEDVPPEKWRYVSVPDGILYTEEFKNIKENLNQRAGNKFGSLLNKLSESKRISTRSLKNAKVIRAEKNLRKFAIKKKVAEIAKKRAANAANRIGARFKGKRNRKAFRHLLERSRHIPSNVLKAYGIVNDWTDPIPGRIARRLEIESDMRNQAARNNANIERAKRERSQKGITIRNEKRRERIDREIRAAHSAEGWRLMKEAVAAVTGAARGKGVEVVGGVMTRGAAGKDVAKDYGAAAVQSAGIFLDRAKAYVQNRAKSARETFSDKMAQMAANYERDNAIRKVGRWRRKNQMLMKRARHRARQKRIERSEEAKHKRTQINGVLRELEKIENMNKEIIEKQKLLKKHEPYEEWKRYFAEINAYEKRKKLSRPNRSPPRPTRPDPRAMRWARERYGNNTPLTKEVVRSPISFERYKSEIENLKGHKQAKSSLQNTLRELKKEYEALFI